jgi:cytoskeletal protein CcmA (bactofilin family)
MFSKSSKSTNGKNGHMAPQKPSAPSIISTDLRIVGDLHSDGEIQIDGTVDGDIRTKILLVGETAIVKGETAADTVTVHGTVNGQIKARSVSLSRTARVTGDILHHDLSIEKGAFLEGHCKRIEDPAKKVADSKINLLVRDPVGEATAKKATQG